ncbi:hypothetical protein [Thiohalorhabdus methylotrophus]|uniref:Uncharacterized protein n=1 Tax=Thiohalorhabdus methylotrophus TaxID=3242694 RepID=A0ABV4TV78_9GAMM
MDQQQRRWLHPWREVKSETYYPSPGLIRLRGRHHLRTPRRALDAREAAALLRETQEVHDRFQAELDRCVDQLLDSLFGPESPSDENGSS